MSAPLLAIKGLRIEAEQPGRPPLLEGLSFAVEPGERLAIVGESGSGKTMATRAIPGLLAPGVRRTAGSIRFEGRELTGLSPGDLRSVRGAEFRRTGEHLRVAAALPALSPLVVEINT